MLHKAFIKILHLKWAWRTMFGYRLVKWNLNFLKNLSIRKISNHLTNPMIPSLRVHSKTINYQNERNANEITDEEQLDYKFDDSNQDIFSYG